LNILDLSPALILAEKSQFPPLIHRPSDSIVNNVRQSIFSIQMSSGQEHLIHCQHSRWFPSSLEQWEYMPDDLDQSIAFDS
jgi:hypothetical protein